MTSGNYSRTRNILNFDAWLRCVIQQKASQGLAIVFASLVMSVSPGAQTLGAATIASNQNPSAAAPSSISNPSSGPSGAGSVCEKLADDGQPVCGQVAGNPINVTNGNKFQREVDMPALPGVLGLELVRNYNSASSRLSDAPSMFGRGWRLSYDWALRFDHASRNATVVLVRGDGTQIALAKDRSAKASTNVAATNSATTWRALGALTGMLTEQRKSLESEYLWTEPSGRRYRFNAKGWLINIEAPTGEFLSIERESKGDITKVTDPQGRTLVMSLLRDEAALRTQRFGGVQAADTPVGRFVYRYGGELPPGSAVDPKRILSRLIAVEHAGITRHYLFEDKAQVALLTGMRVEGAGSDGIKMNQRIATWAYDAQGRAVLSMKGDQERVTLLFLPRFKNPLGVELGATILTNSLGHKTLYQYKMLAGKPHLTEVIGPGCASCGPTNLRHEYDLEGRLLQTTFFAPASAMPVSKKGGATKYDTLKTGTPKIKTQKTEIPKTEAQKTETQGIDLAAANSRPKAGEALHAIQTRYDAWGRPTYRTQLRFAEGRAQTAQTWVRLEYADSQSREEAPTDRPVLIAKPSVVPGQEHRIQLSYNAFGQLTLWRETGFDPVDARQIVRETRYRYESLQGRSVLVQSDGPLPNGPQQSPLDSDITLYHWDSLANHIQTITEPAGFVHRRSFDEAGRIVQASFDDGVRYQQQAFSYSADGRHALSLLSTSPSSWLLKPNGKSSLLQTAALQHQYDALGRLTRTLDAAGRKVTRGYDDANRPNSFSDAAGNRSATQFDTEGRPQRAGHYRAGHTDPLRAAYYWHDPEGRPTHRLLPDGRLDHWRYAANGQLTEHIDGDDIRTSILKARSARPSAAHAPSAGIAEAIVQQASDGDLRVQLRSRGEDETSLHLVDDFGRVVKTKLADHGDKLAHYDEAGRLIKLTHADQSSVNYLYDIRSRLLQKRYEDAKGVNQGQTNLSYEGALLSTATDPEQTTQIQYDSLGRKVSESVQIRGLAQVFKTSQSYDLRTGLISQRNLANGQALQISRQPAELGGGVQAMRLVPATAAWLQTQAKAHLPINLAEKLGAYLPVQTVVEDLQVDPFDGLKSFKSGNGVNTERSFDLAGRMTMQAVDKVGSTRYLYEVGPRIRSIELFNTDTKSGHLIQAALPSRQTFAYSGFGALLDNRPSSGGLLKVALSATEASLSPAKTQSGATLLGPTPKKVAESTRDILGRLVNDGRFKYRYTPRGQIAEVRDAQSDIILASYRYDSLGHRIAKTVHSSEANQKMKSKTTYFLWHDNSLVAEANSDGQVTTQYYYLTSDNPGHAPHSTPIAKWESELNTDNPSKKDRLLFIHTDHRGAPVAMTDQSQKVVWALTGSENPWGRATSPERLNRVSQAAEGVTPGPEKSQASNQKNLHHLNLQALNLRLPGQYFDSETGLHDNFNRSYNPNTGRYLQPDPLGYPDGPDAYLYASGDPVNKIDPLGLYEIDVHYYLTFTLARLAGLSKEESLIVASGSQYIDDNDFTRPLNVGAGDLHKRRLALYHFTQSGHDLPRGDMSPDEYWDFRIKNPNNPQIGKLLAASNYGRDGTAKPLMACTRLQLFGEYLHALEDTFGHRDRINAPIDVNAGLGHGLYGKETDKTYNGVVKASFALAAIGDWNLRESRTLEMERTVFSKIQSNFKTEAKYRDVPIKFADIEARLKAFNAIKEDESVNGGLFPQKKSLLRGLLLDYGLGDLPDYDPKLACELRKGNLSPLKDFLGRLPNEQGYEGNLNLPGTILSTAPICISKRP
jgi:RHS repeat-associated protein